MVSSCSTISSRRSWVESLRRCQQISDKRDAVPESIPMFSVTYIGGNENLGKMGVEYLGP